MGLQAAKSHDVLSRIIRSKRITLEEVLVLRRQVWPDGAVSKPEAEMLFRIQDAIETGCAEWDDFLVETIAAYLVDQAHPAGYVSDGDALWFEEHILEDGKLRSATELEMLVSVLAYAVHIPHRFEMMALSHIRDAILAGDGAAVANPALKVGIVGDPEVALLRRVLYAKGGARSEAVSLDEAELVFDLNAATTDHEPCAAWTTLFVNVLSNYLLSQTFYIAPARDRLKEIDTWLNRSSAGVVGFDAATEKRHGGFHSGGIFADIKSAFGNLSPVEEVYERRSGYDAHSDGGRVDTSEARWLIERITRDATLSENERALLVYLKSGGFKVPSPLERLVALAE